MVRILLLSLLCVSNALSYLAYDADRRVPYAQASIYSRDEYDWWMKNTGEPSRLFYNGKFQEQESGSYDLQIVDVARGIQPNATGIKVAVIDVDPQHMARVGNLVGTVAPGVVVNYYQLSRFYPEVFAPAITNAVLAGNQVILMPTGWATPDTNLLNALEYAMGCVIVCSAPNNPQNVDIVPDYPTSWNLPNVLSISSCDRSGRHYWSGTGTNVVDAPGRNIAAVNNNGELVYASGSSSAAGIAAGCVALLVKQRSMSASGYVSRVRSKADSIGSQLRLNIVEALRPDKPTPHGLRLSRL